MTAEYNGMKFEYREEVLIEEQLPEITHDEAKALLFRVADLLEGRGIHYHLAFGTLLGAIRDHDFIKKDLDVDIYSRDEEKIFAALPFLRENGVELIRYVRHGLFSFRLTGDMNGYIDIYLLTSQCNPWGIYCYRINTVYTPKWLLRGEEEIEFLGRKFWCARKPVRLLKFWYGSTWNVPIGKFEKTYTYDVWTHYAFMRYVKPYLRKLLILIMGKKGYDAAKAKALG